MYFKENFDKKETNKNQKDDQNAGVMTSLEKKNKAIAESFFKPFVKDEKTNDYPKLNLIKEVLGIPSKENTYFSL